MKVRDIKPFHISGEANVFVREKYKDNVELPGLAACLYLYDLNIQTTWFNCNKEDPRVDLHFSYDTLSEENKEIAQSLEKEGLLFIDSNNYGHRHCYIRFEASLESDVETISNRLLDIVKPFTYQDVLYGYEPLKDCVEREIIRFGIDEYYDISDMNVIKSLIGKEYLNRYYDEEENLVWDNEELYQKHSAYLESQKKKGG